MLVCYNCKKFLSGDKSCNFCLQRTASGWQMTAFEEKERPNISYSAIGIGNNNFETTHQGSI